jgi:hypothetical protein
MMLSGGHGSGDMSESEVAAILFAQGAKVAKALTDEDSKQLLSGEAKLALVPRSHRVLEYTPVLDKAFKLLQKLSAQDLQALEDGLAKLAVVRKNEKVIKTFNPDDVARAIIDFSTEGEVVRYLDADPSLGAPNLKKVAGALNLHLPATVKTKQALQSYIAENVIRDRTRWSLQ